MNLIILYFITTVLGSKMILPAIKDQFTIALYGCNTAVRTVATVCPPTFGYGVLPYDCYCNSDAGFGSVANCFVNGYDNSTNIIEGFIGLCNSMTNNTMTIDSFWANYTKTQAEIRDPKTDPDFNKTQMVSYPIPINLTQFKIDREYNYIGQMNPNWSQWFGYGILSYWCLVLLTAAIVNWTIHLLPGVVAKFTGPVSNFWRKYVTLSALYGKRKAHGVRHSFLVPSRMESVIIGFFFLMTAVFCGVEIRFIAGNSTYPDRIGNLCQQVAIRTGILVGFICPLLVLFAGRNNFLQWVTRWNFATFITYHRWVSRMAALLVIIHAITFTISDIRKNSYKIHMAEPFIRWGVVAGICGGIILVQGLLYVRRRSYELFLIIHILMALFFIVGGYKHTLIFGYGPYYWASIAVWALDRAIRFSRLAVFGCPEATVTLLAEETLRVVIPKPSYWHAIPGGHAFIHFMRPSCFWQSHPFTFTDSSEEGNYIVMYIKLKGGITHGVYKHLNKFPGATTKVRVLVEGPYGEATSARKYNTSVFIAGGNGIPGIYSEIIDLSRRKPNSHLKLIWIIREWKSLAWFYQELKTLNTTNINTTIYITKPNITSGFGHLRGAISDSESSINVETNMVSDKAENEKKIETSDEDSIYSLVETIKAELNNIIFKEGRPDIDTIVKDEIKSAEGSTAFITCGHPLMVDDIRYSVANNLELSKHRMEYFEQLQVWN